MPRAWPARDAVLRRNLPWMALSFGGLGLVIALAAVVDGWDRAGSGDVSGVLGGVAVFGLLVTAWQFLRAVHRARSAQPLAERVVVGPPPARSKLALGWRSVVLPVAFVGLWQLSPAFDAQAMLFLGAVVLAMGLGDLVGVELAIRLHERRRRRALYVSGSVHAGPMYWRPAEPGSVRVVGAPAGGGGRP